MFEFEYDGTVEKQKSVRRGEGADEDRTAQDGGKTLALALALAQQDDGARGCRSRRWRRLFMQQK